MQVSGKPRPIFKMTAGASLFVGKGCQLRACGACAINTGPAPAEPLTLADTSPTVQVS